MIKAIIWYFVIAFLFSEPTYKLTRYIIEYIKAEPSFLRHGIIEISAMWSAYCLGLAILAWRILLTQIGRHK